MGQKSRYGNLCLKQSMANSENLKEPEDNTASSASDKQKTKADGPAVPGTANSIR
jgi:hypothetical protein